MGSILGSRNLLSEVCSQYSLILESYCWLWLLKRVSIAYHDILAVGTDTISEQACAGFYAAGCTITTSFGDPSVTHKLFTSHLVAQTRATLASRSYIRFPEQRCIWRDHLEGFREALADQPLL